jgi:GDP/UDP-N,N'-diacetylbacillosamine 2-epimerase (hydrolysing)
LNRKICLITGSRADYGLQKKLIAFLKSDPQIQLQIIATGAHLSSELGLTYKEIENDGFKIDFKIDILGKEFNEESTSIAMNRAQTEILKILIETQPDLVLILGDRYEILSAAISALLCGIPVAHMHGGEVTVGAIDDSIRHAITKMSHLHFVATDKSKRRVIQMGEKKERVFNFGGLGVDAIVNTNFLTQAEIEKIIGQKFNKKNQIVTFHPETISKTPPLRQVQILLSALNQRPEINLIFTGVNADPGADIIANEINNFVKSRQNAVYIPSLGQRNYFSTLLFCDGVIGNSSSGILEVPSFRKATINIGNRQLGREYASSVISCDLDSNSILEAIDISYSKKFEKRLKRTVNPYGNGGASRRIYDVIKDYNLTNIVMKPFNDL